MGLRINFVSFRDGETPVSTSTTTAYAAGQPLKADSTGLSVDTVGTAADGYVGLALTTRAKAVANGGGNAAFIPGVAKVELFSNASDDANDTAPFDTALVYAAGELLRVNTNGLWSNTAPGGAFVSASAIARLRIISTTGTGTSRVIVALVLGVE